MVKKPMSKKSFSFEKWGSLGTFKVGHSLPIDYVMTTFQVSELGKLTFARDVNPDTLDFELLMQRDIDEQRVNNEIVKYLAPDKTGAEIKARPTFFPPLLVAVIPVVGKKMTAALPDEIVAFDDASGTLSRTWGDIFRITFYESEGPGFIEYTLTANGETKRVEPQAVKMEMYEASEYGEEHGIRLVVFDGQHRLSAIKKLASKGLLQDLTVPVCIVYAPTSTESHKAENSATFTSVTEVFRALFVDVNKNAIAVGGHFQTLLSDMSLGSISARVFCEEVLNKFGKEGLGVVEWNIKSKKDATQLNRSYSIASVGILDASLRSNLAPKIKRGILKHVLDLGLVHTELYPEDLEDELPQPIEWDKFAPLQRRILVEQARKHLVRGGLLRLFFEPAEFQRAKEIFIDHIKRYQQIVESHGEDWEACHAVLGEVLDYRPVSDSIRWAVTKFEKSIEGSIDAHVNRIIRYAVFQRAMIDGWFALIETFRNEDQITIDQVTTGYIALLDYALNRDRAIFSVTVQPYMKHSVFRTEGKIKPTEGTKVALTNLILACLGNEKLARTIGKRIDAKLPDRLVDKLRDLGFDSASEFASHYQTERMREFLSTYSTDFSIPQDDRTELKDLMDSVDAATHGVREGTATKQERDELIKKRDKWVSAHITKDMNEALEALRLALDYEQEIMIDALSEKEESEEEE